jgi:hypothetical protein
MLKKNLDFSLESELLELLALGIDTYNEEILIELIKSGSLHWGELLEQSIRHKILPLLAFSATNDKCADAVPFFVLQHLQTVLDLNRHKINILRREAVKLIKAFNEQNIRFVCTKGITLESTLYQGNGSRYLLDIDFMISPEFRHFVISAINKLGYQIGEFDWQTKTVRSNSRETMTIYNLNPDHLPHSILLTKDPVVPFVDIDFANSLTWTHSPFEIPIDVALSEIIFQPIPDNFDVLMPRFNSTYQFIFTILHLFREAWIFREAWVKSFLGWESDVTLSKFADVIRLWRAYEKELNTPEFIQLLEKYQIIDPILWVLEHTDRTFHTGIVPALGLEGRVTEEWLHSAGGVGGKRVQWKGTMRERLHCKDRRQLFLTDT